MYQWLLFFHVTGAFLLLGGGVVAAALNLAALRREPSEILLLRPGSASTLWTSARWRRFAR
jgi:hypothetical protein